VKGAANCLEVDLDGSGIAQLGEQLRQLLLALGFHSCAEQRVLVSEVAVHGEFGYARFAGDGVHAAAFVAMAQEQRLGGFEDGLAFCRVFWTTRALIGYSVLRHAIAGWSVRVSDRTIPTNTRIP